MSNMIGGDQVLPINEIIQGDCLEVMRGLPDNSVDSIVTDPPYNLTSITKRFGGKGAAPAKYGKNGVFQRTSSGFMGKKWDGTGIAFKAEMWEECLRVLKPGGHLLSFGGSRTYHRMACAIEDAGFSIRDQIQWIYGSGFPKSANISKHIDKAAGVEREVLGPNPYNAIRGKSTGSHTIAGPQEESNITAPATPEAKQWEGWGTALKPAHEPLCMARKPLSEKTIAANVLKWGTGGINIGSCRVGTNEITGRPQYESKGWKNTSGLTGSVNDDWKKGRFPANIILDGSDEVVQGFPQTKSGGANGNRKSGPYSNDRTWSVSNTPGVDVNDGLPASSGSAARFFYCAKTSKKERNMGCEETTNNHPTVKPIALMEYLVKLVTPAGGIVLDPFCGSGSTLIACKKLGRDYIGIDLEKEYVEIAEARVKAVERENKLL